MDVGAELCGFMALLFSIHISKIPRPRPDPISPTERIPRGRDLILSTQSIPRGRDPILSTQTFGYANASPLAGDVERKLAIFKNRKYVHIVPFFFVPPPIKTRNTRVDMLHITTLFIGKTKNAWSKSSKNLLNRIDNMEQVFQGGARFCMRAMLMKMPIFK